MYLVDVKGTTARWQFRSVSKQKAIREVFAGRPWESAIIYDDQTRVIGRLSKRKDKNGHLWIDFHRGLEGIPAWSKRA